MPPLREGAERTARGRLLGELAASLVRAVLDGDLAIARLAHEALGKLIAEPPEGAAAEVIDLAERRRDREP